MTAKTKIKIFAWFAIAFLVCVMVSICNDMRQAAAPVKPKTSQLEQYQGTTITVTEAYPNAEVIQYGRGDRIELVIIATVDNTVCISHWLPNGIELGIQVPCHDAIPFPVPKGFREPHGFWLGWFGFIGGSNALR